MYNGMGNDPANLTDPSGGAPPDWGRMVDANGVQHAVYDPSIIDNASAAAYAAKNGYASGSYLFKSGPFTSTQFGVRHWLLLQGGGALPTLDASGLLTPLQPMRGEVALPYALQARTTPLAPSFSEAMPTPSGFVPPSILFPAPFVAPQPMVSYLNNPPANYHRTEEQWKAIGEAMDKLALEEKRARWDRESPMGDVPLLGSVGNMFYRWRHGDISGGLGYGGWALVDGASMGVTGLARKGVGNLWRVGTYSELRGLEVGLDAHHVGQKALMGRFIPGYNPNTAPSILVPKPGHTIGTGVVSRGTTGFTNARQVLARDIFELRRVYGGQGIPNSSLQQLIQMNKITYPQAFIK